MEPIGPCCPACGSRVKLPRNAPLPPPQTKVKCPSCGSVGELEAFVRAAAGVADSGSGAAEMDPDPPAAETQPNLPVPRIARPASRPADVASPASRGVEPATRPVKAAIAEVGAPEDTAPSGGDLRTRISGSATALDLPAGIRCTLTVLTGPDSGKKLSMSRPRVLVGRDNGDFPLSDNEVSREHCAFEITGVTCTVKDLGSRNGTWIDGERVQSRQLSNVGEVTVGNSTILFTMTLEDSIQES